MVGGGWRARKKENYDKRRKGSRDKKWKRRNNSAAPGVRCISELLTLLLRLSTTTIWRKLISATYMHDLILSVTTQSPWPISEGWNMAWLVNRKALPSLLRSLFITTCKCNAHITAVAAPIHLSISCFILLLLMKKIKYLNCFVSASNLTPNLEGSIKHFLAGNNGLRLQGADPHPHFFTFGREPPLVCRRSRSGEAHRAMSSAKSTDTVLWLNRMRLTQLKPLF